MRKSSTIGTPRAPYYRTDKRRRPVLPPISNRLQPVAYRLAGRFRLIRSHRVIGNPEGSRHVLSQLRLKTTLGLALALGTIAPSAASARLELNPPPATPTRSTQPAVQVIRVSAPGGFDWGDAGIGAAGGLGLSMLAMGGGLVVTQRRGRRLSGSAATTS